MAIHNCSIACRTGLVAATAIFCLADARSAMAQLKDFVASARYDTRYETVGGDKIRAIVQFRGMRGTYSVLDESGNVVKVGRLSGIKYFAQGDEKVLITGKWALDGSQGFFQFDGQSEDGSTIRAIHGGWGFDPPRQGGGKWSGSLAANQSASTIQWGGWKKDPGKDRYFCQFRYPAKDGGGQMNAQICLWYPNDPNRSGYYYFVNKNNQVWGRCVCPADPGYNADVMMWSKLKDGNWNDLNPGDCPAPADGDPESAAIGSVPDPPI